MKNNSTYINNYSQFTNSQSGAQSSLGVRMYSLISTCKHF